MNELIKPHLPCDDKMQDILYAGVSEGAVDAIETAISIDRGNFEHPHNVLDALMHLAPLLKVLEQHVAANND